MEQLPGFVNPQFMNHVSHLKRALCGLKQAPHAWFDRLSVFLLGLGFICSNTDSSLFVFKSSYGILLVLIYVDDIIVTGSNSSMVSCSYIYCVRNSL